MENENEEKNILSSVTEEPEPEQVTKYYWKNGFYISSVHTVIPEGAVEITEELYQSLLSGQSQGKIIVTNEETGMPELQDPPVPPVTLQDYDDALEAHLLAERTARGYTTREPDYYINSSVERWKQDALDWIAHRDAVMIYGLQVENDYTEGKPVPTLDEFKAALPKIQWTLEMEND